MTKKFDGKKKATVTRVNVIENKSLEFAVRMVGAYQYIAANKREWVLSKRLLRCGTSIVANGSEGCGAVFKADLSNEISIAYKECLVTRYWISLLWKTEFSNEKVNENIYTDADEQ